MLTIPASSNVPPEILGPLNTVFVASGYDQTKFWNACGFVLSMKTMRVEQLCSKEVKKFYVNLTDAISEEQRPYILTLATAMRTLENP